MKSAIIIPARLASTRLPNKLLLNETGKPLIQHTYQAASRSRLAYRVVVATDSQEIADTVSGFGGEAIMTSATHESGTDRVAEAAAQIEADLVVNVQGDEPEIEGEFIDLVIRRLQDDQDAGIATLATPIRSRAQLLDPSCVKVVFDRNHRALYFSRSPIPTPRNREYLNDYFSSGNGPDSCCFYQHIGVYAYRRELLMQITDLPRSMAERLESLEQLRFLNHGWPIAVEIVDHTVTGIDTAEDYARFVNRHSTG